MKENLLVNENMAERKKNKRLDWIIYLLAAAAFVLMIVVIVYNNKSSIEISEADKPIVIKEEKKTQIETLDAQKQKELERQQLEKQKELEKQQLEKEKLEKEKEKQKQQKQEITKQQEKQITQLNTQALSKYPVQPDKDLSIVSYHKVKPGESLWKIASLYKVRTINLIAVNVNLKNPDKILPGQMIAISNK